MTRRILYSPGYGAGWVSWHHGDRAELLFMLEHVPTIEAIDRSDRLGEADAERFLSDFRAAFPGRHEPYMGGFDQLRVQDVPDGRRVRIVDYDGSESVIVESEGEDWL